MPIITAYSGSVSLQAGEEIHSESFYRYDKSVYGSTLGELYDNLVEASVGAAEDARIWITTNKPFENTFSEDYWRATVTLPDIIKCQEARLSDYLDSASTMRVRSLSEIVGHSVLVRDTRISHAEAFLRLSLLTLSSIPVAPALDISGVHKVESLEKMTKFGWTGTELENILEIARRENRIGSYNAKLKYSRRLSDFESLEKQSEEKTAKPRKKWWIF